MWGMPPLRTIFQCSIIYFMHFMFVSSCCLVWSQILEGAHTDGAAGGECWRTVFAFLHPFSHSPMQSWIELLSCRCTWRNPVLTSSAPKRPWGESFFFFFPFEDVGQFLREKLFKSIFNCILPHSIIHLLLVFIMINCLYTYVCFHFAPFSM